MFTARNLSPLPERDRNGIAVVLCAPHIFRYFAGELRDGMVKNKQEYCIAALGYRCLAR